MKKFVVYCESQNSVLFCNVYDYRGFHLYTYYFSEDLNHAYLFNIPTKRIWYFNLQHKKQRFCVIDVRVFVEIFFTVVWRFIYVCNICTGFVLEDTVHAPYFIIGTIFNIAFYFQGICVVSYLWEEVWMW